MRMRRILAILVFALVALPPVPAQMQERALSVTVTPPLTQLAIGPGESWSSLLKIVNNNPYEVTYYAQVLDFEAQGELGKGDVVPVSDSSPEAESHSLARWVSITTKPITVPAGTSGEVPFTVTVPTTAEPGGHYAAILIGTQPDLSGSGPRVAVSSYVTSLLFVRIHGDVDERGRVREFLTTKSLYQSQLADFMLRFENIGNVHLRPQGHIKIYNMWGRERGQVEFNQRSSFGNVLPKSTRRFEFSWQGEPNMFDIGRYRAVVTLQYGEDLKQTVSAATYFWVIPVMPLSITLGTLLVIIIILVWFIRRYVRRALQIERISLGLPENAAVPVHASFATLMKPLEEGVGDLRSMTGSGYPEGRHGQALTFVQFLKKYVLFFIFLTFCVFFLAFASVFLTNVLDAERDYTISEVSASPEAVQ